MDIGKHLDFGKRIMSRFTTDNEQQLSQQVGGRANKPDKFANLGNFKKGQHIDIGQHQHFGRRIMSHFTANYEPQLENILVCSLSISWRLCK